MHKNKGITIISLVITIILLLILAGISIQSITNTGIFEGASQAKKETKRAQIEEWLNLKLLETQITTDTSKTSEEIIETTRQNVYDNISELQKMGKNVTVEETSTEEDGEQVEIYFYVIVDKDVYKVSLKENGFIGESGKFLPIIKLESITGTINSITVQVSTKRNEGGKIEYYIKAEDEEEYGKPVTKADTETTYTYTGLEQNKNYNIKIVAVAENKQTAEVLIDKTLGNVTDLTTANTTFTYSPVQETWTNGSVTATVSTTVTGYTLQTSKDGQDWSNETSQTFTENGTVYARLWDGANAGAALSGNVTNIDTVAPKAFIPTATSTTNSITVTASTEDGDATTASGKSGISGYRFKLDSGSWTEYQTSGTYTWDNLAQTTDYTITVEAKDNAGNTTTGTVTKGTETVTGDIIFSTATWTNENASITISTNTSYTIQYQINSTTGTWTTGTSVTGLVHGDKVYARLWDGTNGGVASAANNILDGIDPSASIKLSETNTTTEGSITATVTHTDNESGVNIANCKWVYNTTSTAIGTDENNYTGGTFSSNPQTITLSTSTAGTYYLHVLTTDVAGRTKEIISTAVTVYPLLANKVSIGDYVAYDATSNKQYIANDKLYYKSTHGPTGSLYGGTGYSYTIRRKWITEVDHGSGSRYYYDSKYSNFYIEQ